MGWSVKDAISHFERLSDQAFSKRDWAGVPIFRDSTQLLFSHRFKSKNIDRALQEAFGQGLLFGPNEWSSSDKVKVGVVAAIPGGRRPYLFTNYSRNSTGQDTDYLVREDDLEDEMKTWEAARSTSAAPTYFEPYYHRAKRQQYIDGALHRNNPIQIVEEERRAIWKDKVPPDILLSIGTGIQVGNDGTAKSAGKLHKTAKLLIPKGLRGRIAVGLDVVQSTLDCERQWNEFVSSIMWDRDISRVCHRLNIGLDGRPPKLDDIEEIPKLKAHARAYLRRDRRQYLNGSYKSAHKHISIIAQRLTAALFHFEQTEADNDGKCIGILHCRLGPAMRSNFQDFLSAKPTFRARSKNPGGNWYSSGFNPVFDEHTFASDITFDVRSHEKVIELTLPKWSSSWERISGFPARR